jgi:hypothetical protein
MIQAGSGMLLEGDVGFGGKFCIGGFDITKG